MNYNFKAGKQRNVYKCCLYDQWWTWIYSVTRTSDQRATTGSEQANKKEQGNKFGKALMLKVYMCSRTLICQKLGSEDSSARLYWSSCRRSHRTIWRTPPVLHWHLSRSIDVSLFSLKKTVKAPNRVGAELQLLCGWGAARHAAPSVCIPSAPCDFCLLPLCYSHLLVQTCSQSQLGHFGFSAPKETEEEDVVQVVVAGARVTGTWAMPFSSF